MTELLIYFFLAVAISFLCSLLESILLSISLAQVSVMEKEGKKSFTNYILPTLKTLNDLNLNDSRWEFLSHTLSYELLYAFSE